MENILVAADVRKDGNDDDDDDVVVTTTTTTNTTTNTNEQAANDALSGLPSLDCDGRWIPWDDGHVPETLLRSSNTTASTKQGWLAVYPDYFERRVPTVRVHDNVLPMDVVQAIYETTTATATTTISTSTTTLSHPKYQPSAWGTYVTLSQVREYWNQQQQQQQQQPAPPPAPEPAKPTFVDESDKRDWLALLAVEAFLRTAVTSSTAASAAATVCVQGVCPPLPPPPPNKSEHEPNKHQDDTNAATTNDVLFWTESDLDRIHGVAVWALSATTGSQVNYHLDYAEQVRYESNCIVPPILAGTLQCSNLDTTTTTTTTTTMVGGEYWVHMGGLDHYQRYGYKGNLRIQKNTAAAAAAAKDTRNNIFSDALLNSDPNWIRVPYRCNRMTIQSGHLPHLSTTIQSMGDDDNDNQNKKRVVMGFNVFLPDIGDLVQRAPEHSQVFRRKVALQRWLFQNTCFSKTTDNNNSNSNSNNNNGRLTLELVRSNPALCKLVILAKRQRVKEDLAKEQQQQQREQHQQQQREQHQQQQREQQPVVRTNNQETVINQPPPQ